MAQFSLGATKVQYFGALLICQPADFLSPSKICPFQQAHEMGVNNFARTLNYGCIKTNSGVSLPEEARSQPAKELVCEVYARYQQAIHSPFSACAYSYACQTADEEIATSWCSRL